MKWPLATRACHVLFSPIHFSSSSLQLAWEKPWKTVKHLCPCHPQGRPKWSSGFWLQSCPAVAITGSDPVDTRFKFSLVQSSCPSSLPLCNSSKISKSSKNISIANIGTFAYKSRVIGKLRIWKQMNIQHLSILWYPATWAKTKGIRKHSLQK